MKLPLLRVTLVTLLFASPLYASVPSATTAKLRLVQKLEALVKLTENPGNIVRTVTLLASPGQLSAVCENPDLSLAGHDNRLTGKRTAVARCGMRKFYLPFSISAQGTFWVASHSLKGWEIVQPGDISPMTGSIDDLPVGLMFEARDIVGQRLLRPLSAGKPVLQNQLRQQWRLRAGQTVELVMSGPGFFIRSQGKALNNAAVDDTVRVKTTGGRNVTGKVGRDGAVTIFLEQ